MVVDPMAPFGSKAEEEPPGAEEGRKVVPWVNSTPTRTMTSKMPIVSGPTPMGTSSSEKDKEKDKGGNDNGAGTELLLKLAQVKQQLAAKGIEDAEVLNSLMAVEEVAHGPQAQKLTHKVVTQLQKAEKSKDALREELQALDARWKEWHEYMVKKHLEQKSLFVEKREKILQKYSEVRTKIADLKTEIKTATESMLERKEDEEEFLTAEAILQDPFTKEQLDLTGVSDDEVEMLPAIAEGDEKRKGPQVAGSSPLKRQKK